MWPWPKNLLSTDDLRSDRRGSSAGWRQIQLVRAGFAPPLAAAVARERAIDLHALIELVERGCPPEVAARILAPLDDERLGLRADDRGQCR
jgi:hypothetical protein